ncbi:MAG: amidase, partial [Candidatus Bathyarchaeota archaeon]|nr:amidase [Candidatus Bathyarchaeota archaeon]
MPKLHALTAKEIVEKIRSKEATAEECVLSVFERIHELEDKVHAFVTLSEEEALKKAKEIDEKVSEGKPLGRLAGIALAV